MVTLPVNLQASAHLSIPGVGSVGDVFHGLLSNSPDASALSAKLNTYASDPNLTSMALGAAEGIAAATQGKAPTTAQVESIATGVATAAAVVAGVAASVAGAAIAPMAAVVFGAGTLIGAGIKKVFNITNCGITSGAYCDGRAAKHPGEPGYMEYGQLVANYKMINGVMDSTVAPVKWLPYTHGAFETAMRPVIMKIIEVYGNCGALPSVKDERVALQGLVNFWNAHAPPGTPMRAITWMKDDLLAKYPNWNNAPKSVQDQSALQASDPIQHMMFVLFNTHEIKDCHESYTGAPWPWHLMVADIPVAVPPPPAVVAQHIVALKANAPPPPVRVLKLSLPGPAAAMPIPPPPQPSQVGGPLVTKPPRWRSWLPYVPAVAGAACFPAVGAIAPMVGCVTSAMWMMLRKKT